MKIFIDAVEVFDDPGVAVKVGSWEREKIERSCGGLNGVISIDLGLRSREIIQKGILRAKSFAGIGEKIEEVEDFIDGKEHSVEFGDGRSFERVRVDTFLVSELRHNSSGVFCDYKMVYTQLGE